jgi:hypothetical protein
MARRVNKRFLIVFGSVVLVGLAGAFALALQIKGSKRKEQTQQQVAQADRLVAEAEKEESSVGRREKLTQAAINLETAVGTEPRNAELNIKLGDVLSKMTAYDPSQVGRSRQRWMAAIEADATNVTAMRRLMESYYQEVQIRPSAGAFGQVEDRASAINKIDPKDKRAQALMYIAPVHQWLANIETPVRKIDGGIEGLRELAKANPADPEAADWVFW